MERNQNMSGSGTILQNFFSNKKFQRFLEIVTCCFCCWRCRPTESANPQSSFVGTGIRPEELPADSRLCSRRIREFAKSDAESKNVSTATILSSSMVGSAAASVSVPFYDSSSEASCINELNCSEGSLSDQLTSAFYSQEPVTISTQDFSNAVRFWHARGDTTDEPNCDNLLSKYEENEVTIAVSMKQWSFSSACERRAAMQFRLLSYLHQTEELISSNSHNKEEIALCFNKVCEEFKHEVGSVYSTFVWGLGQNQKDAVRKIMMIVEQSRNDQAKILEPHTFKVHQKDRAYTLTDVDV